MKTFVYFVSYAHAHGFGWGEFNLPQEITTARQLTAVQDFLAEQGLAKVAISSFQLLRVEG